MVDTEWTATDCDGVALVAAVLHNDAPVERRVRVEPTGDGPTWPPRRAGYPVSGWEDGALETTLAPGERRAVGFATPGDPGDPPVRVETGVEPPDGDAATDPGALVGRLGDPSPPRAAVPREPPGAESAAGGAMAGESKGGAGATADEATTDEATTDDTGEWPAEWTPASPAEPPTGPPDDDPADAPPAADEQGTPAGDVPPAVAAWLSRVEARAADLERAAAVESVTDAARATEAAGGLSAVEAAVERAPADARALRRVARRAERLADRLEGRAEEVPLAALRGLA